MSDGQIYVSAKTDLSQAQADIEKFSKRAQITLTNLNQVVADLPFGFIGIQNNLPGLIQSFTTLTKESGGVVGALKGIGTALIGPVGLLFAFNAVISGITFLIQKYGSLGQAFDALFGKINLVKKAQEEYNKKANEGTSSKIGEIAQINILVKTLGDLSKPLADRQAAYVELKKINPDIVAGYDKENAFTIAGTKAIIDKANATIEYIKLKIKENAIIATLNKTGEEQLKRETALGIAKNNVAKSEQRLIELSKSTLSAQRAQEEARLKDAIERQNVVVVDARKNLFNLYDVQNSYYKLLDPIITEISKYDSVTQNSNEALKEANKKVKDVKESTESYYKILRALDKEKIVPNIELAPQLKDINYGKLITKDQPLKIFDIASYQAAYDKLITKLAENPIKPTIDLQPIQLTSKQLSLKKLIESGGFNELEERFKKTKEVITNIFLQPLTDLFDNFFKTGKLSFKEFGKTILAEITKIASKLIATGIIELISTLFNPANLLSKSEGNGSKSSTSNILSNVFGKVFGTGSANFAGVQGGGMDMSGNVNLVLRGTDLVGSINRTNMQINRIG